MIILFAFYRCSDESLQVGADCEASCNNERQTCLEPCFDPVFDNDCLDVCTAAHLQCMRTCPCVTVGDCAYGCPCPNYSCSPTCENEVDFDPAQENELNYLDILFSRLFSYS